MNIVDLNTVDLDRYIESLSLDEGYSIKKAICYYMDVADFAEHGHQISGDFLPWSKTHQSIALNDGQLSVWAGYPASGKSLLLGQVMTTMMLNGHNVCIASMEMSPTETIYRMMCQSATCKASPEYVTKWMERFERQLRIYDQLNSVKPHRILGMVHYAAHELKCKHIVIDSLTKCGMPRDDYSAQASFVDKLQWAAKTWKVQIHLVCHMRKPSGNSSHKVDRNDIRGVAELVDLADNVFIVRRNREKEKHAELKEHGCDYDPAKLDQPCAFLSLEKNRRYGIETEFGLYFHHESGQYTGIDGKLFAPLEFDREAA